MLLAIWSTINSQAIDQIDIESLSDKALVNLTSDRQYTTVCVKGNNEMVLTLFTLQPGENKYRDFDIDPASYPSEWIADPDNPGQYLEKKDDFKWALYQTTNRGYGKSGAYLELWTSDDGRQWDKIGRYGYEGTTSVRTYSESMAFFKKKIRAIVFSSPEDTTSTQFYLKIL